MRGRKPQSPEVKEAKGNPGRRPIPKKPEAEAEASASGFDLPALPSDAGVVARNIPDDMTERARKLWTTIAPELERLQLLKATDATAFRRYCELLARWHECEEELRGKPLVLTTTSKFVTMERVNRYLQAMLMLDKRLTDIEDRFGMNPKSRQTLFLAMAAGGTAGARPPGANAGATPKSEPGGASGHLPIDDADDVAPSLGGDLQAGFLHH